MNPARLLSLACLAAASGLEAQTVTVLAGGLGSATSTHSQSLDTTGGLRLGVGLEVEYLVVGGGGGGGGSGTNSSAWGSGGGGAGGLLAGTKLLNLSATSAQNTFAVVVGSGGSGGPRNSTASLQQGSNGGNSSFDGVVAIGGGGGGAYKQVGNSGGSGGGGGGRGTGNNLRTAGGAGTSGQGFAGGASRDDDSSGRTAGGGGGGAGGLGGQGGTDSTVAGNGGLGLANSITGSSLFYAAGGGGGAIDTNGGAGETAGTGGSGIGGNGSTAGNGSAGAANTGSGGGGVGHEGVGGTGGSGIVVVRYRSAATGGTAGTGGSVAAGTGTADGYTVHQFTSAGSSALNLTGLDVSGQRMVTKISGGFTGAGNLEFNGTGLTTPSTFILTGNSSAHTGAVRIQAGATLQVGEGGTAGSLGSGDIFVNQGSRFVFDRSDNVTLSNRLRSSSGADAGELVKRGSGTLTLANTSSTEGLDYAGVMKVEQGNLIYEATPRLISYFARAQISEGATFTVRDLRVASSGWYGMFLNTSGSGRLVLQGTFGMSIPTFGPLPGALNHTGGTVVDGMDVSLGFGSTTLVAGTDLTIQGGGKVNGTAAHVLGDVLIEDGVFSGNSLSAESLVVKKGSMTVRLSNTTALTKSGSGEFALHSGNRNRTAATRVEDGILRVDTDTSLGQGAVTVAGGTLRLVHGYDFKPAAQRLTSLVLDGGAVETTSARLTHLDASVLDLRSGTISLQLEGKGALAKTTAGTVTLGGDNARYAGSVTVSDGTLRLLTTTSLGTASTVLLEGGTIELAGNTRVGYFEQTGGTVTGGTLLSSLVLTESGTLGSVLADSGGPSGILKRTAGTTLVAAANTFTGAVNIQQGVLRLDGAGSFASSARLVTSSGGTLDLAGKAQTLGGIEGDGAIALGAGGALTVSSASSFSFDGSLGGAGTLVKSGGGILSLNGANTHTGGTSVTGGTLVVNGTLGSGTVGVASGATLGGSGTIAGATVISGTHSPGNSPGVQTFASDLTYASGSSIVWELDANAALNSPVIHDQVVVGGDLDFGGPASLVLVFNLASSAVDWSDVFWDSSQSWKIFDVAGAVTGFDNLTFTSAYLDASGDDLGDVRAGAAFGLSLSGGDVYLTYTAVPEPSAYGLALGALALAGAALRRRRTSR